MKADMNKMLKVALNPSDKFKKEFKGPGEAFLYGFIHAPEIIVCNWIDMRKREKAEKGLRKMKKLIDEMDATGKYSNETMNNIHRWLASAYVEYVKMF